MIAWALRVFNLLLLHFGQPNLHFWVLLPTQNYNQVILFISRLAIAGMYHSLYSPPATVGNRKNKRKDWAKTNASLGRWTFPQLFIGNKNYGNDYCRYLNICINTEWYTFNYSDFFSAFFFFKTPTTTGILVFLQRSPRVAVCFLTVTSMTKRRIEGMVK